MAPAKARGRLQHEEPIIKSGSQATDGAVCMPDHAGAWQYYNHECQWTDSNGNIRVERGGNGSEQKVPLKFLIGSLKIAKQYLFEDLLESIVTALLVRLSLKTFDLIARAAIGVDCQPLRLFCLQFASKAENGV